MKRKKFTSEEIIVILKEQEQGKTPAAICHAHGISITTFYRWKNKFEERSDSVLQKATQLERLLIYNIRHRASQASDLRVIRNLN